VGLLTFGRTAIANDETRKYCSSQWSGDHQMQELCLKVQSEESTKFFTQYYDVYVKPLHKKGQDTINYNNYNELPANTRIVLNCLYEWELTGFETHDWQMVTLCCDTKFKIK